MWQSKNHFSYLSKYILLSLIPLLLLISVASKLSADDANVKKFTQDALRLAKQAAQKKTAHRKQNTEKTIQKLKEKNARKKALVKRYSELLKKRGIGNKPEELQKYLDGLFPNTETEKKTNFLIHQMGDDDFFKREEAMKKLLAAPSLSMHLINQATENRNDLEIRWRAKHVQKIRSASNKEVLRAIYRLIQQREDKGMATTVLKSFAYSSENYMKKIAAGALVATAELNDLALLRETVQSQITGMIQKRASIKAIELLLKKEADTDLKPLLKQQNEIIQLAAATAMLNHGTREGLPVLVKLLESKEIKTRLGAVIILRAATGKQFKFIAYNSLDKRTASITDWKKWVTTESTTAELKFPLLIHRGGVKYNRTLVAYYSRNIVVEYDSSGKEVWKLSVIQPYGCQGLKNGNRLVLSRSLRTIYEYNSSGKLIWKMDNLPLHPSSCQRLENGNTLIACSSTNKIIEVTPGKKTVWEATFSGYPVNAKRLDNGHTLITLQRGNKVSEIDEKGKVVWEIRNLRYPNSAIRLPNGNTLICNSSSNAVSEYNPAKEIVWSKKGVRVSYDVQRLENGNTIISNRQGVKEYGSFGKVVWQPSGKKYGAAMRIHRY